MSEYKTVIYKHDDKEIETYLIDGDIWLSQKEMAILLDLTSPKMSRVIKKIENNGERISKMKFVINKQTNNLFSSKVVIQIGKRLGVFSINDFASWIDSTLIVKMPEKYEIVRFNQDNLVLDIRVSPREETVWMDMNQMAELFGRSVSTINRHIINIYKQKELDEGATCAFFAIVQMENGREVTRTIANYNLDLILSVGFRVNSTKAIKFRMWARNVLKQYLIKGYAVDKERLSLYYENVLKLENDVIQIKSEISELREQISEKPIQRILYNGQFFDAYEALRNIIARARKKIVIIDPYADDSLLSLLTNLQSGVKPYVVVSKSKSCISDLAVNSFNKQYSQITIGYSTKLHDRIIIIDDKEFYDIGASINGIGGSLSLIVMINDEVIKESLLSFIKDLLTPGK